MKPARPVAAILLLTALVSGQPVPVPEFEVASIKPTLEDPGSAGIDSTKGRIAARNVTLKRCIRGAYGIPDQQVLGGPRWIDENRYDIDAKAAQPVGDAQLMLMLQTLLTDRFKLALHRETRPLSGYALVTAKAGMKAAVSAPGTEAMTDSYRGRMEARACTMERLVLKLAIVLRQPVVDATGLKDAYDFQLTWTPDDLQAKPGADTAASGPSLFSAIQEQLGLRLEARRIQTEVLIVDHAEEPSAN